MWSLRGKSPPFRADSLERGRPVPRLVVGATLLPSPPQFRKERECESWAGGGSSGRRDRTRPLNRFQERRGAQCKLLCDMLLESVRPSRAMCSVTRKSPFKWRCVKFLVQKTYGDGELQEEAGSKLVSWTLEGIVQTRWVLENALRVCRTGRGTG